MNYTELANLMAQDVADRAAYDEQVALNEANERPADDDVDAAIELPADAGDSDGDDMADMPDWERELLLGAKSAVCREQGHATGDMCAVVAPRCPRCGQTGAESEEIQRGVSVTIIDLDTDEGVAIAADSAREAMLHVGIPVLSLPEATGFDGDFLIDVPQAWWDQQLQYGIDIWAETGNVAVTITVAH